MKQIETYEELSALASAQLRRGVKTNTIVTKEAYGAAVDQHRLRVYSEPDSLLLLQKRDGHTRMNFFLNTLADLQELLPADTVTEIAYRPRDIGLQEAVDYWQRQGFVLLFERMRFSRPAGMAAIDSPIPVRKPAEAELETVVLTAEFFRADRLYPHGRGTGGGYPQWQDSAHGGCRWHHRTDAFFL